MFRVLFLILILMSSVAFAQTEDSLRAYKFDEFGKLQESEWKERLDRFSAMQISIPNSKLYIIVYPQIGTDQNSNNEIEKEYNAYLSKVKKY